MAITNDNGSGAMNDMELCSDYLAYLADQQVISAEIQALVLAERAGRTPQIGQIALNLGLMGIKDIARVLDTQVDSGLRFGEQACALGLINNRQLQDLLDQQNQSRPRVNELLIELGGLSATECAALRADYLAGLAEVLS